MPLRPYLHKRHSTYFCKFQTTGKYLVGILFEGAFFFCCTLVFKRLWLNTKLAFQSLKVSRFQNVLSVCSNFPKKLTKWKKIRAHHTTILALLSLVLLLKNVTLMILLEGFLLIPIITLTKNPLDYVLKMSLHRWFKNTFT